MTEQNKYILENGIAKLPTYEPNDDVWLAIESRLPLLELSNYEPPLEIWQNIENQLFKEKTTIGSGSATLKVVRKYQIYLAAASIALLGIICISIFFKNTTREASLTVSTEVIDNQLNTNEWHNAEKDFELVETFCKTLQPACEKPEFKQLKLELDDLNQAKKDLQNVLSPFNNDEYLAIQLAHVENERADILKKMIIYLN